VCSCQAARVQYCFRPARILRLSKHISVDASYVLQADLEVPIANQEKLLHMSGSSQDERPRDRDALRLSTLMLSGRSELEHICLGSHYTRKAVTPTLPSSCHGAKVAAFQPSVTDVVLSRVDSGPSFACYSLTHLIHERLWDQ
jgi:hypothetical protein